MIGPFEVRYTSQAREDLLRLHRFMLQQAETLEELDDADDAVAALFAAIEGQLSRNPFLFRKVGRDPFTRELVIPFKTSGYVDLYDINADATIDILAVRHQLEDDYH